MNDKDKEAFEKWFKNAWDIDFDANDFRHTIQVKAFFSACEYKQKEIDAIMSENQLCERYITQIQADKFEMRGAIEKLEAENAELKKVLCFYANGYAHEIDDSCNAYFEDGHIRLSSGKRARQVLKELD